MNMFINLSFVVNKNSMKIYRTIGQPHLGEKKLKRERSDNNTIISPNENVLSSLKSCSVCLLVCISTFL